MLDMARGGITRQTVADKHKIHLNTLNGWCARYNAWIACLEQDADAYSDAQRAVALADITDQVAAAVKAFREDPTKINASIITSLATAAAQLQRSGLPPSHRKPPRTPAPSQPATGALDAIQDTP